MEYIVKLIMKGKGNEFKNNPNLEGVWQLTETHEVSELCFNGLKEVIKTEEVVNEINLTIDERIKLRERRRDLKKVRIRL